MSSDNAGGQKDLKTLPRMDAVWEAAATTSITMAKKIITRCLNSDGARRWAVCLVGESGIGKNELQEQVCRELGVEYMWFSCKGLAPEDLRGFPMPVRKLNGEKYPGDLEGLTNLMYDYYHKDPVYTFQTLEYLEKAFDPSFRGILHFDELAQASKEVQEILYSLFYDRRIDNKKLSDGALIVISMNPPQQSEYMLAKLSKALVDRFAIYKIASTSDEWIRWASVNNIHPTLLSFVTNNPQVYDRNKGRRLKHFSDMLYTFQELQDDKIKDELKIVAHGCIDIESANSFGKYIREVFEISGIGVLLGDKSQFKRLKTMLDKDSRAVQMHKVQADMNAAFMSPKTHLKAIFDKSPNEGVAYNEIAKNLVNYMMMLGEKQMMDSNVSLLKTLISASEEGKDQGIMQNVNSILRSTAEYNKFYLELMACMNIQITSSVKTAQTMTAVD